MTTATLDHPAQPAPPSPAEGHYGWRSAVRMEWLKLRSVRSTAWIMLVFAAGMIGVAILALGHVDWSSMSKDDRAGFDPTNDGFAGLAIGQLAFGVLGAVVISSEYRSGMIRATFAA